MKAIRLWSIERDSEGGPVASPVNNLQETKTENDLEELLVSTPELLMPGLALVGRQTPTEGGPLDLLGVNEDGNFVVFELKRGALTREAVAQVVDYVSYLHELERSQLCEHIENRSGTGGIEKIDDFEAWYQEKFPNNTDTLREAPSMVLVGLGVDERTRRMVEFLAASGLDVSLITFHAFQKGDQTLVAKQVEVAPQEDYASKKRRTTKQDNEAALQSLAEKVRASELLSAVAESVRSKLPAYEWPNQTGYTYSLTEFTERGTPSARAYIGVMLNESRPGQVGLVIQQRAAEAAGSKFHEFQEREQDRFASHWGTPAAWFSSVEEWQQSLRSVEDLLRAVVEGWKAKSSDGHPTET